MEKGPRRPSLKRVKRNVDILTEIALEGRMTPYGAYKKFEKKYSLSRVQTSFKRLKNMGHIDIVEHQKGLARLERKFYDLTFVGVVALLAARGTIAFLDNLGLSGLLPLIERGIETDKKSGHGLPLPFKHLITTAIKMDIEADKDKKYKARLKKKYGIEKYAFSIAAANFISDLACLEHVARFYARGDESSGDIFSNHILTEYIIKKTDLNDPAFMLVMECSGLCDMLANQFLELSEGCKKMGEDWKRKRKESGMPPIPSPPSAAL